MQVQEAVKSGNTAFAVLLALSISHLLNDTIQSLMIAAVYPVLKESYQLSFTQIGLITLAFQLTASLLQPLVGMYTDRRPLPFSLTVGMGVSLCGLLLLSVAANFPAILSLPRWWASGLRSSTPSRRGWPGWLRAVNTDWPSRCSRSAGTAGRPSARCSPRSSLCHGGREVSPGSHSRPWRRWSYYFASGSGIRRTWRSGRRSVLWRRPRRYRVVGRHLPFASCFA